jgi:hypothetical protein
VGFQRLLNFVGRNAGDVAKAVAPGSALAAGFGLLEGPAASLAYGATDFAAAFPATLAARALGSRIKKPVLGLAPKTVQTGLEQVANIGASLGGTVAAANFLYGNRPAVVPTNMSQEQQIMQQMMQRSAVNELPQQAVARGTQFQTSGIEFLQNYTQPKSNVAMYLSPEDVAILNEYGGLARG